MKYRTMPHSPDRLSVLGFGLMRLPTLPAGALDREESLKLMQFALDGGINYFDTAVPYMGGESEALLGEFLSRVGRDKVFIATKLPCWLIKTPEDLEAQLEQHLEKLKTSYIDYYLLHSLGRQSWSNLLKLKVLDFLDKAKADGRIRFVGFSFHDHYPVFRKIVERYDWDFCQIMLNYLDTHYQAGLRGYRLAVDKGMGVIAMEPLRGGKLVHPIPAPILKLWEKSAVRLPPVERALRWVWNLPGCTVALSGMSNLEQLKEDITLASAASENILDARELDLYKKVRREYIKRIVIPCTECRYCLPCPHSVAIPFVLGSYNEAIMFDDKPRHKQEYQNFIPDANKADKCTNCGACLPKCPQKINIPAELEKVKDYFAED